MSDPGAGWTAIETAFQSRQTSRGKSASSPPWAIVRAALSQDWKCNYFYLWKYSWEFSFSAAHCCTWLDKLATERLKCSGTDAQLMLAVSFQSSLFAKNNNQKIPPMKTLLQKCRRSILFLKSKSDCTLLLHGGGGVPICSCNISTRSRSATKCQSNVTFSSLSQCFRKTWKRGLDEIDEPCHGCSFC